MDADKAIQFRDSALKINSSADGQLDIDADVKLDIVAPAVDMSGTLDVSGTIQAGSSNIQITTSAGNIDSTKVGNDTTQLDHTASAADAATNTSMAVTLRSTLSGRSARGPTVVSSGDTRVTGTTPAGKLSSVHRKA